MKNKILAAYLGGIFLCLIVGYWLTSSGILNAWSGGNVHIDESKYYKVAHVVDGDTFAADIDGRIIRVRMLGINTPETVDPRKPVECYGSEASNEAKTLLDGRMVRLVANLSRELKDKYGRYLFYVYRDDGLFVNENLIKNGFAREYTFGKPYSMQVEFRKIEKEAVKENVGLWSKCAPR